MDVERLRLLRELADRGTVSAAAQAMSLTPSAVSQQLKILQREAGVPLLEPDGRRLRLTDAGRILVTRTDEILAALDRAQADMDSYRSTPSGTVRVGIFGSGAAVLLAGLITRAAARGVEVLGREFDQSAAVPALPVRWSGNGAVRGDTVVGRYQYYVRNDGDATIRVLVGEGSSVELGTSGLIYDVELPKGGKVTIPVPAGFNGLVHMLEGGASFGANHSPAKRGQIAVLGEGGVLAVDAAQPGTRFVLMAGQPYGEQPVYNGPYVD